MTDDKNTRKEEPCVTPIGTLQWPYLQTPRGFKGDKANLYYDTQLILEGAAAAEFAAQVDEFMSEAEGKFPGCPKDNPPIAPVLDEDRKVVKGKTAFKFRVPSESKTKKDEVWDRKPIIVDSLGEISDSLMGAEVRIGPGTKARISFIPYLRKNRGAAGVTMQPIGVQVLELIELRRSTKSLGFGAEKGGGYVAGKTDTQVEDELVANTNKEVSF
jgi:hypothetical protein